MIHTFKRRTYEILKVASEGDTASKIFDLFIVTLIILNVIAVILETEENLSSQFSHFFHTFEIVSVVIFTIEYVLRVWSCTIDERFRHRFRGRIRFALTPLVLVDLIAILPFYLPMIMPVDLRFVRVLRLFRLLRVFKLGRYSESLRTLGNVLRKKRRSCSLRFSWC